MQILLGNTLSYLLRYTNIGTHTMCGIVPDVMKSTVLRDMDFHSGSLWSSGRDKICKTKYNSRHKTSQSQLKYQLLKEYRVGNY